MDPNFQFKNVRERRESASWGRYGRRRQPPSSLLAASRATMIPHPHREKEVVQRKSGVKKTAFLFLETPVPGDVWIPAVVHPSPWVRAEKHSIQSLYDGAAGACPWAFYI